VVVNPGWGDAVQANKAGLMEIADIFVINKADRDGASDTRRDLEQMLELSQGIATGAVWRPPIVSTVALRDEGVDELWSAVADHRAHLTATGLLEQRRVTRLTDELRHIVAARLLEQAGARTDDPEFERLRDRVLAREIDPWGAAGELLGLD